MPVARRPIRLLLVDDHEVVRVGLRTVSHNNQGITVVGEAGSKAGAVQAVKRLKPDIVLMDVRLPDGSGVEVSRDILAEHPTTRSSFSHPMWMMIPSWRPCWQAHMAMSSRISTLTC